MLSLFICAGYLRAVALTRPPFSRPWQPYAIGSACLCSIPPSADRQSICLPHRPQGLHTRSEVYLCPPFCFHITNARHFYLPGARTHGTGAANENRTRVCSLEGCRSTIELLPRVELAKGLEPVTRCLQSSRSGHLSYASLVGYASFFSPMNSENSLSLMK